MTPSAVAGSVSRVGPEPASRVSVAAAGGEGAQPEDEGLEIGAGQAALHTNSCTTQLCMRLVDPQNHDGNHIRRSHSACDSGSPVSTG
jgi:hypothetical protein